MTITIDVDDRYSSMLVDMIDSLNNTLGLVKNISYDGEVKKLEPVAPSKPSAGSISHPASVDEVRDYIIEHGWQDKVSASLFYTEWDRKNWETAAGKPINNWQSFLKWNVEHGRTKGFTKVEEEQKPVEYHNPTSIRRIRT